MDEPRLIIEEAGLGMLDGETCRIVCPYCNDASEKSMVLRRNSTSLTWYCYRASCGARGSTDRRVVTKKVGGNRFVPKHFKESLSEPPKGLYAWLERSYHITEQECRINGIRYAKDSRRLYLPCFDDSGSVYGAVVKRLPASPFRGPKAVRYTYREYTNLHFPATKYREGPVVIVEDILSSIRIAQTHRAAALLGTKALPEAMTILSKITSELIICLDPDAMDIAGKIAKQWSCLFHIKVVSLPEDPKDCSVNVLNELLPRKL